MTHYLSSDFVCECGRDFPDEDAYLRHVEDMRRLGELRVALENAKEGRSQVPRIRSIHPDICDDEVVADLSPYAFRTWVLLWTQMDDKGRAIDSAKLWAGKLYPLNDKMTAERVEKDLSELEERGLLIRYEVDGRRFLSAKPTWSRWQKPQHPTPSKLPPIPSQDGLTNDSRTAPAGVVGGVEMEGSGVGEEGESEGEVPARTRHPQAGRLEARAAKRAEDAKRKEHQ